MFVGEGGVLDSSELSRSGKSQGKLDFIQYSAVWWQVQCSEVWCSVMWCGAGQRSTIQYNAMQCNAVQCNAM